MRSMATARVVAMVAMTLPVAVMAAESREFSVDIPAQEIRRLELDANVGEVEIVAADINVIEVRAKLEPDEDWFGSSGRLEARLKEATLEHDVSGGVLALRMKYKEPRGDNDLEESWQIRVPVALALDTELNVGSMRIEGTSGGVEAEVNVGELDIDVLAGDIDAEVNVGELDIRTASDSPGEFDLESNIGEVRLRIDGKSAGNTDGWLGKSLAHNAGGEDDVSGRVNVGEVRVEVR